MEWKCFRTIFPELIAPSHEDEESDDVFTVQTHIHGKLMTSYNSDCCVRMFVAYCTLTLTMGKNTKSFHSQKKHPKYIYCTRRRHGFDSIYFSFYFLCMCEATTKHINVQNNIRFWLPTTKIRNVNISRRNEFSVECVRMHVRRPSTTLQLIRFLWLHRTHTQFRNPLENFSVFISFLFSPLYATNLLMRRDLLLLLNVMYRTAHAYRQIGSPLFWRDAIAFALVFGSELYYSFLLRYLMRLLHAIKSIRWKWTNGNYLGWRIAVHQPTTLCNRIKNAERCRYWKWLCLVWVIRSQAQLWILIE